MTLYEKIKKLKFISQGLATYLRMWVPIIPRHRIQFNPEYVRPILGYHNITRAFRDIADDDIKTYSIFLAGHK